jgi:predicted nuclease with RNAse H fold
LRALGIDVGVRRGLDLAVLDEDLTPTTSKLHVELGAGRISIPGLGPVIEETAPDIVAIDSPPGWATRGRSRQTERELRPFGIQSYGTPTADRGTDHDFYGWMRVGFEVFQVAEACGYPRYGRGLTHRTAIEVFPHATAVVLARCLPPPGARNKRGWRTKVLEAAGVDASALVSLDHVDATLAALTGLYASAGRATALGDPSEGVIVLPTRQLPPPPFRRCHEPPTIDPQDRLPGMRPCTCGDPACGRLTAREFAPGHDAKRKSALWRAARAGHEAVDELRRRGWELPPEMR